ncbi:MAG TPA: CheR family methyltransferase [Longimicrobiales bacterium]|nr:CheR family methyltransferase [Longimicrobiales bacterium]
MKEDSSRPEAAVPVVGVGGSAGALAAILDFLRHLPPDPGMAFVVILHLAPDRDSQVPELIGRATRMPVTQVTEKVLLEPNHVYVIPPDHNLSTEDGHLCPLDRLPSGRNVAAIDIFFRAIAESHGHLATGIIFSGTGSDGAQGLRRIKEGGGFALVQSPEEAEFPAMPAAAVRGAAPDRVLGASELGPELVRLRAGAEDLPAPPAADDDDATDREHGEADVVGRILGVVYRRTGHDFSAYKRTTVGRRVRRRMQLAAVETHDAYLAMLRADAAESDALRDDLLITVTSFFRDPDAFAALEEHVLPELLQDRGRGDDIRIWVPGCATGEEAYSLAILILERLASMDAPPRLQVFATDASEGAIQTARTGLYSEGIRADLSAERLRHFDGEPMGLRVRKSLREPVLFAVHDLLRDPPFSRMDLVACRNLLIYLKRDVQERVLATFHYALNPGGFLFLGSAESANTPDDLFGPVDKKHRIFRARPVAAAPPPRRASPPAFEALDPPRPPSGPAAPTPFARHLTVLERLAPPSLVVDRDYEVLHLSPRVGRYLRVRGGEPTGDLLALAGAGLDTELRTLLYRAFRDGRDAIAEIGVEIEGEATNVRLSVRPFRGEDGESEYAVVVFDELLGTRGEGYGGGAGEDVASPTSDEEGRLREQIRIAAAEHARTVEQFQAAYEELQSAHEEQKATGEELETSQEELQSVNEELRSLNQEFRGKLEELAEVNADLRNLIDSTDIATIFLDRELRIRRYTPTVTTLFNFVEADIGRPLGDVTHRLRYPQLLEDAQRVLDSLERSEREVAAEDERWFTVRLSAYRSQEDRIEGVVLTFHDTTERKRAELERQQLFDELDEANRARANFVGVMSHEFRTPLSSIIAYLDVIGGGLDGDVSGRQAEHLDRIRASAYQLNAMVEEILDYFRLEEGASKVTVSGVDIAGVAAEALDTIAPQARSKGIELRSEVPGGLGEIETDRVKLLHILTNLLSNALKFTDQGWISLAVRATDGTVAFSVADSGIGIADEDQERIFERFWQVHTGTTRAYGGTGLGLTIVRDLTRLLRGEVEVESEPGRGSRFTVSLPAP